MTTFLHKLVEYNWGPVNVEFICVLCASPGSRKIIEEMRWNELII